MRRPARITRVIFIVGIGVLAIFLLGRFRVVNYPLTILHVIFDPISGFTMRIRRQTFDTVRALTAGPRYARELNALRQEFSEVSNENARLLELREENNRLRSILSFQEKNEFLITIARVVGRINEGGTAFFTLNKGSEAGITPGAPVMVNQVFVGKIIRTGAHWSIAAPLTAPGIKTAATLAGYEKNAGILEGELNLGAVLRFIPKDVTVHIGTPVISSGLEEKIFRGLLIGVIERVESQEQDLFQTAYLKTTLRLEDASLVSVIVAPQIGL